MIVLRGIATLLLSSVFAVIVYRYGYLPVWSSHASFVLDSSTTHTESLTDPLKIRARAQRDRDRALHVLQRYPAEVSLYLLAARNSELAGRREPALSLTLDALAYGKRPEILLYAGILAYAEGDRARAVDYLEEACMFDPALIRRIPGNIFVPEVTAAAAERARRLQRQ
jgi:tetratricopeptide (TPR) repeat protein